MWWARVLRCRLEHAMATRIEAVRTSELVGINDACSLTFYYAPGSLAKQNCRGLRTFVTGPFLTFFRS